MVDSGKSGARGLKFFPVQGNSYTRWYTVREDRDLHFKKFKDSPEFRKVKKVTNRDV